MLIALILCNCSWFSEQFFPVSPFKCCCFLSSPSNRLVLCPQPRQIQFSDQLNKTIIQHTSSSWSNRPLEERILGNRQSLFHLAIGQGRRKQRGAPLAHIPLALRIRSLLRNTRKSDLCFIHQIRPLRQHNPSIHPFVTPAPSPPPPPAHQLMDIRLCFTAVIHHLNTTSSRRRDGHGR